MMMVVVVELDGAGRHQACVDNLDTLGESF
jgi:hypothetical protein